ncbi:laccase-14-like [Punica granatum]|nr:laccase-14-like [Punica granatum]
MNFTVKMRSLVDEDHPNDVPMNVTTKMFITVSVSQLLENTSNGIRMSSGLNNMSWVNPSIDVLTAYYMNQRGFYTMDFPDDPPTFFDFTGLPPEYNTSASDRGTRLKVLNVEIFFQGTNVLNAPIDHPMHLHGYCFYVVGEGRGN